MRSACRLSPSSFVLSVEPMHKGRLRCAGCGEEYAVDVWRDLPRICTLSGADVHPYVIAWPEGRVVEVRVCQRCGQSMARAASVSPQGDPMGPSKPSRGDGAGCCASA